MSIGKMGRLATVPLEGRTDWPDDRLARRPIGPTAGAPRTAPASLRRQRALDSDMLPRRSTGLYTFVHHAIATYAPQLPKDFFDN